MVTRLTRRLLKLVEPPSQLIEAVRERVEPSRQLVALLFGVLQRRDRAHHLVIVGRELQQVFTARKREIENSPDHAREYTQNESVDEPHRCLRLAELLRSASACK